MDFYYLSCRPTPTVGADPTLGSTAQLHSGASRATITHIRYYYYVILRRPSMVYAYPEQRQPPDDRRWHFVNPRVGANWYGLGTHTPQVERWAA
jgi:hypothetical protein